MNCQVWFIYGKTMAQGGAFELPIQWALHLGHLNNFLQLGEGNLTAENRKVQMPGGLRGGGKLKVQIDRCINEQTILFLMSFK